MLTAIESREINSWNFEEPVNSCSSFSSKALAWRTQLMTNLIAYHFDWRFQTHKHLHLVQLTVVIQHLISKQICIANRTYPYTIQSNLSGSAQWKCRKIHKTSSQCNKLLWWPIRVNENSVIAAKYEADVFNRQERKHQWIDKQWPQFIVIERTGQNYH